MTAPTAVLAGDLDLGLRRLRLGAMRRLAPELLITAKTQRWSPEEFLRTLIEAEVASRDASNARARLKQAAFPVIKTLDEFNVKASSVKPATFDYLASLEWIAARENACLVGPAGTGKSHLLLVALGHAAVDAGHRVRYFTAPELAHDLQRAPDGPRRVARRQRPRLEPADERAHPSRLPSRSRHRFASLSKRGAPRARRLPASRELCR